MKINKKIIALFFLIIFTQPIPAQNIENIELFELIEEYESFSLIHTEKLCWCNVVILFTLNYEGSDLSPADMVFFSNSIMVLKSNFYSENLRFRENRFFHYSLNNNILKITHIDSRMDIARSLNAALFHMKNNDRRILFVDEIENSITYDFTQNIILFGGFYFCPSENKFILNF